jgi:hypothetical protein
MAGGTIMDGRRLTMEESMDDRFTTVDIVVAITV